MHIYFLNTYLLLYTHIKIYLVGAGADENMLAYEIATTCCTENSLLFHI